jgi:glycosyltransferase involved in cell wall biosynthesis
MLEKIDELSVFFPTYNEEKNISKTVKNTRRVLQNVAKKWEILIINDGSKDKTEQVSRQLEKLDKNIKLINHKVNKGYGGALKTGFSESKYKWVSFTDSDGQFDFSEITNFIEKQRESSADVVIGYYKKRQVSKFKIVTSKVWEYIVFFLFGLKVRDIDCGFKLISKKVIDDVMPLESERGAFISSEFLIKAKNKGYKIVEIPVTHYPRIQGSGTGRNLDVIIQSFIDLFKLRLKLR